MLVQYKWLGSDVPGGPKYLPLNGKMLPPGTDLPIDAFPSAVCEHYVSIGQMERIEPAGTPSTLIEPAPKPEPKPVAKKSGRRKKRGKG